MIGGNSSRQKKVGLVVFLLWYLVECCDYHLLQPAQFKKISGNYYLLLILTGH